MKSRLPIPIPACGSRTPSEGSTGRDFGILNFLRKETER